MSKKTKETKSVEVKEETKATSTSPKLKAFYIIKEKGIWQLVTCELQDDKVISKKVKECATKAESLESFKIAFAETYYFGR